MKNKMYMRVAAMITAGMLIMTGCGNTTSGGAQTNTAAEETNTETLEASVDDEKNTEEIESLENGGENVEESESAVESNSLVLKEQGMFSAGGTVITSGGTFDCRNAIAGYSDFFTLRPDLAGEWDYDKNQKIRPDQLAVNAHDKVWWKCNKGHSWRAAVYSRTNGSGCPYCAGKVAVKTYFIT